MALRSGAPGRDRDARPAASGVGRHLPSISIVTASYNRAGLIEDAIKSVMEQPYEGTVEHIVVDGGSTDDTLTRLRKYPHLKVVSEPDDGVYDAYNKGVALATGELIGILNDDDLYAPNALQIVGEAVLELDAPDNVVGRAIVFDDRRTARRRLLELSERPAPRLDIRNLNWITPMLNARFFHARVFERYGPFDTRYRVEADLDFLVRLALARVKTAYIDHDVVWYRSHEGSITLSALDRVADVYTKERLEILHHHLGRPNLGRREMATLRRLHTWQCCTSMSRLPRPISLRAASGFWGRGLVRDPWFVPRLIRFAASPRRRANPWRGVIRSQNGSSRASPPPSTSFAATGDPRSSQARPG